MSRRTISTLVVVFCFFLPAIAQIPRADAAIIEGTIFLDSNGNGIFDSTETGVDDNPPYRVFFDSTSPDSSTGETTTDANGFYRFENLIPGIYSLGIELVPGFQLTIKDAGFDDMFDSDFDPVTRRTDAFEVTADQILDLDAGVIRSIPEPDTLALFGFALVGLAAPALARRRKSIPKTSGITR